MNTELIDIKDDKQNENIKKYTHLSDTSLDSNNLNKNTLRLIEQIEI